MEDSTILWSMVAAGSFVASLTAFTLIFFRIWLKARFGTVISVAAFILGVLIIVANVYIVAVYFSGYSTCLIIGFGLGILQAARLGGLIR